MIQSFLTWMTERIESKLSYFLGGKIVKLVLDLIKMHERKLKKLFKEVSGAEWRGLRGCTVRIAPKVQNKTKFNLKLP